MNTMSNTVLGKTALFLMPMILGMTTARPAEVTGPYFGQTPPRTTPTPFGHGIVSLPNIGETRIVFSPNGDECFFGASSPGSKHPYYLFYMRCVSNVWTAPALAPFHPRQAGFTGDPFFTADGNRLYFTTDTSGTAHLYVVERTPEGWGSPQLLPYPINTSNDVSMSYSETLDRTGYFVSSRPGGSGFYDIWRTCQGAGQPLQVENLGPVINTAGYESDPYVDPNGRYLLFDRGHAYGVVVSFSDGNGGWNTSVNIETLVPGFNTGGGSAASVSPDGKYLFWVRGDAALRDFHWVSNPFVPQLAISLNNTNVNLSWSANYPDFALESTDELAGAWTPVPGVTGCSATLPVNAESQFFRLKK